MFKYTVNENLYLRLFRPQDAVELFTLIDKNRLYLKRFLPWLDSNRNVEASLSFIRMSMQQYAANNGIQCGMYYNEKLVGVIGTHTIDWINKKTALGYWVSEDMQGKGIVTESVKTLLEYGFKTLLLNKIEIKSSPENEKSKAIPEKLGMHLDGNLRKNEWMYDHFNDNLVYSMLRSEWIARREES